MKSFLAGMVVATFLVLSLVMITRVTKNISPEIRYDTLFIYDTLRDTIPKLIHKEVIRYKRIPVYLPDTAANKGRERDTTILAERSNDTDYISLPFERKKYKTDRYFAVVEGYEPALRYIETYDKTVGVTIKDTGKRKSRWGFGVQTGVGYRFDGKPTSYIGVGIHYNLITW